MQKAVKIFTSAVTAVSPKCLINKSLFYDRESESLIIKGTVHSLKNKRLYVVGAGKAVLKMALEIENILGPKISDGVISVPFGNVDGTISFKKLQCFEGAKDNLPDEHSVNASMKIKALVEHLDVDCILIVLISGGGSALMCLPHERISLDEKLAIIKELTKAGATIEEMNTVRIKLSAIKGGQLAQMAHKATVISLVLSDIIGDPLHLIASGPTLEGKIKGPSAREILSRYGLLEKLPSHFNDLFTDAIKSTSSKIKVENYIIGNNELALQAAKREAEILGYNSLLLSCCIAGTVDQVAINYLDMLLIISNLISGNETINEAEMKLKTLTYLKVKESLISEMLECIECLNQKPLCLVLGGETTVLVKGRGKGGRNQELALRFSVLFDEYLGRHPHLEKLEVNFLSAGTDGIDGPTDAAGALGSGSVIQRARAQGIQPHTYLDNNDSYNFYSDVDDGSYHVKTGHTYTNVMDVHLILISTKL